ncbi:peptide chain release factor [Schizosaccharomyces cryophilus OY26]|uniref:Peptide chain release factor n=1 Tax=Schizosaccharomyces cryophilus (strain OY26 / ATCC MYA-4695 / CBS 11777 / NBRC 106824 / NRRL Y48691) TaxID=653667 RepID=S9XKC7_SCHCR|nr:peptide chain release factor [Schizosaccharomyces cryophilus OY26]EPY54161.1 peptide chain release factor [Schizosaccharomyces cryophilus OY26]
MILRCRKFGFYKSRLSSLYLTRLYASKPESIEHSLSTTLLEKARNLSNEYQKTQKYPSQNDINFNANNVELAKRFVRLQKIHNSFSDYESVYKQLEELRMMEASEADLELKLLAQSEANNLQPLLSSCVEKLENSLLSQPPTHQSSAILEIRPGVGGTEAALFAKELADLYARYASYKNWKTKVISSSVVQGTEGISEMIFSVDGESAYGQLMLEGGVHRVQRTPATETKGRVHTSTASVIVLPQMLQDETSSLYSPSDIRIEVMRSRGAGGQHVNRTESAVRLTHIPTGITVSMQDSRSQHQNREKAFIVLNSRLAAIKETKEMEEERMKRKVQVSSSSRSEKLRTYNFNQNRVTDHRLGLSFHDLDSFMEGTNKFDEFLETIRKWNRQQLLTSLDL